MRRDRDRRVMVVGVSAVEMQMIDALRGATQAAAAQATDAAFAIQGDNRREVTSASIFFLTLTETAALGQLPAQHAHEPGKLRLVASGGASPG